MRWAVSILRLSINVVITSSSNNTYWSDYLHVPTQIVYEAIFYSQNLIYCLL